VVLPVRGIGVAGESTVCAESSLLAVERSAGGLFVPKHHRPSQSRLPNAEPAGNAGVAVLLSSWEFGSVVTQIDTHYALAVSHHDATLNATKIKHHVYGRN